MEVGGILDPTGAMFGIGIALLLLARWPGKSFPPNSWLVMRYVLPAIGLFALIAGTILAIYAASRDLLFVTAIPSALIYLVVYYVSFRVVTAITRRIIDARASRERPPEDDS
jgi:hypothetical protein